MRIPVANSLLMTISLMVAVTACELIVRAHPITDQIATVRTKTIDQRYKEFEKKKGERIVALGDSFLEWRAGEGSNMLDRVQEKFPDYSILNLGKSGLAIDEYINLYNKHIRFQSKPDLVILFIYLGNDVKLYPSLSDISRTFVYEEPQTNWVQYVKRNSALLNLIFRYLKRHMPVMKSGVLDRNIKFLQKKENLSNDFISARTKAVDPSILKLAESDAVNPWVVSMGVAHPDYYKKLYAMRPDKIADIESTVSLVEEFYKKIKVEHFGVVLIPESLQVSMEYDDFYKRSGFNLEQFSLGERRKINSYLKKQFLELGISVIDLTSHLEKEEDVYLPLDIHFNKKGHRVAARSIVKLVSTVMDNSVGQI